MNQAATNLDCNRGWAQLLAKRALALTSATLTEVSQFSEIGQPQPGNLELTHRKAFLITGNCHFTVCLPATTWQPPQSPQQTEPANGDHPLAGSDSLGVSQNIMHLHMSHYMLLVDTSRSLRGKGFLNHKLSPKQPSGNALPQIRRRQHKTSDFGLKRKRKLGVWNHFPLFTWSQCSQGLQGLWERRGSTMVWVCYGSLRAVLTL